MNRREFGIAGLALGASAIMTPTSVLAEGLILHGLKDIEEDAIADLAYVLGLETYVYGFPLVMMECDQPGPYRCLEGRRL